MKKLFETIETICYAVVYITVTMTFLFRVVDVDGSSMANTLADGDRLIISNLLYSPEKGDIVVTDSNNYFGKPLIKRVIATAGDTVEIDYSTGNVFLNGKMLDEPYIREKINPVPNKTLKVTVPEGYLFVMGDNRNHSSDSRDPDVGVISEQYIMGHAVFRMYPFSKIGLL